MKVIRAFLRKWRKLRRDVQSRGGYSYVTCWEEEEVIPKDVPKGHMVVYVGEGCRRYVISVALLQHPLFLALLDEAWEMYEYNSDSKLCIPCDESVFLSVLQCVGTQQDQRAWLCF